MLERDYIMRIIQEFMAALAQFLEKDEIKDKSEQMQELYNKYVGPSDFLHTCSMDDLMDSFKRFDESERLYKMEMLAELYYAESDFKIGAPRNMLLERALLLFNFIDKHSKTYSIDRLNKIADIKNKLE